MTKLIFQLIKSTPTSYTVMGEMVALWIKGAA